jgi:hypothetical protein
MVPELLGTIAVLVLFGVQQPDLFRTVFWKVGAKLGYNSDPVILLYAYANHRPLPTIPFVWSQTLTNFNVAISIVSLFVLLGKLIMVIMKVYFPILALVLGLCQTALYAVSVYGQMGPDYLDPDHPSRIAWYIKQSCSVVDGLKLGKHCAMAKGTFAVTVFMLALYLCNTGLAAHSMLPNPELDIPEDDDDDYGHSKEAVEMQPTATPAVPFTPRTQAFHTLESGSRKLPLRQYA